MYSADDIGKRQSISTLVFHGYLPVAERALAELARHGIGQIELLESPDQFDMTDSRSVRWINEACRAQGIRIAAYHCWKTHFNDVDTESARVERVDRCRAQIDTMLEVGGHLWGSHAAEPVPVMAKSFEELARHVEGTDAVIAVENFKTNKPGSCRVEERVQFLDEIDLPFVGMILDVGHVLDGNGINPMTVPGGPTRVLELCGHRLRHVHLHGFKENRDHFPPLTEGDQIQWPELFQGLHRIGYEGVFNFEPRGVPWHQDSIERTGRAAAAIASLISPD
jgi:sugar phosphate isomerase/epimerase